MRFNVRYDHSKNLSESEPLYFHGLGVIFFHDTALIVQGNMPKFDLFFLSYWYKKVLFIPTIRTIPYSTIVKYKKPGLFDRNHRIIYKQPDEKKSVVKFKMTSDIRTNNADFIKLLEEYLKIVHYSS